MTLRLMTLMSVVLLISLVSLGLLMTHSQDKLMDEVARTASAVGQATLRTLEFGFAEDEAKMRRRQAQAEIFWKAGKAQPFAAGTELTGTLSGEAVLCETDAEGNEHCTAAEDEQGLPLEGQFFIQIPEIHAKSDPSGKALMLTIPTVSREFIPKEIASQVVEVTESQVLDDNGRVIHTTRELIQTPISVKEYEQLFRSIRARSLFLLLGVFVVGSVLSAGLATRFTRPIRRLDAGIRSLSEGDLDVEVEVRGKDEIARLSGAFNEMTRKLRAARERSREVVRKEKLSALGRLAAGVAHDVRNPLHSIGLTLQHLTETGRPRDADRAVEFDRSLEIIRGEIRRLDQLVGNFLSFATSDRNQKQEVDLAELLRETARLVAKEAEWRKVDVVVRIDESDPVVHGDGEALRSSILNLVLNSFEAMPEGGRLGLHLASGDDGVTLEVTDTGTGIPEADQDRVFDFAYTTREKGSGLGLAMVHQYVVEEHGGRVSLESRPEEGTRVRVVLPRNGVEEPA